MKSRSLWIVEGMLMLSLLVGNIGFSQSKQNVFQKSFTAVKNFFKAEASDSVAISKEQPSTLKKNKERQSKTKDVRTKVTSKNDWLSRSPDELYNMSLDENLAVPNFGNQNQIIKEYQKRQARRLIAEGQAVESMKGGMVIVATIPSDKLFMPNDTILYAGGNKELQHYLRFLKVEGQYRVLLAMHSDNTGTAAYTDEITSKRVLAVLDWLQANAVNSDYVIPYAMGASEPLRQNNSLTNRSINRRLEIYLVPGIKMVDMASKGELD